MAMSRAAFILAALGGAAALQGRVERPSAALGAPRARASGAGGGPGAGRSELLEAAKRTAHRRHDKRGRVPVVARASHVDRLSCPHMSRHQVIWEKVEGGYYRGGAVNASEHLSAAELSLRGCHKVHHVSHLFTKPPHHVEQKRPALIPYPASLKLSPGEAPLNLATATLVLGSGIRKKSLAVKLLRNYFPEAAKGRHMLLLNIDEDAGMDREGYRLTVTGDTAYLNASSEAGIFYGVQTILQLVRTGKEGAADLPAVEIEDEPLLGWRGMHLDVSRHFFGVPEVKQLLDVMAMLKYNVFHWHLTDDQGWRMPVGKYPKLTDLGALDLDGEVRAYSAEDIRDVVAYARERFIEVLPEVDVPGHAQALIAAYPEFGNTDIFNWEAPSGPARVWGVMDYTLNPSEETFSFLEDIVDQVTELFPFPLVHIGGDEVETGQWDHSRSATTLREQTGGKDVQGVFNQRVADILRGRNRTMIGWDEVQHMDGLPRDAVVMAWRGIGELETAVRSGHYAVNADSEGLYFDHYQGSEYSEPKSIGGFLPLETVYNYEPVPASLNEAEAKLVLGAQAQLWSEYFPDWHQVEYMAHPRSLALAEKLWSPTASIVSFEEFKVRLEVRLKDLEERGVNFRPLD